MLSFAFKDLFRNRRRTSAAAAGVALAVGLVSGIAFFVDSSSSQMTARAIAPVAIDMQAGIRNPLATTLSVDDIARQIRAIPGVGAADPVALADLPAGSLSAGGVVHNQAIKLVAISPNYIRHFPVLGLGGGSLSGSSALASQPTADLLRVTAGRGLQLSIPGRAMPVPLSLGGVADLSKAMPLFVSRNPDNQGEVVASPYVLVVDYGFFQSTVLPGLKADAAAATPVVPTPPVVELDVALDRAALSGDPTTAVVRTQGLRRTIERLSPGDITAIDNLSDSLNSAQKDTTLAKVLFIFLGLPGVLLAAYLSRYAGGLLAESQRRERAMLRARGIRPAQLLRILGYNAVAVAVLGSVVGLALGAAAVVVLFGTATLTTASPDALWTSVGISVAAGLLTTVLALYLPARRSLSREVGEERRELATPGPPAWMRARLDLVLLAIAAVVGAITYFTGGYKPTTIEGQSVSLSFYVLLAPLFFWIGATLLAVRLLLAAITRLPGRGPGHLGPGRRLGLRILWVGIRRRPHTLASGVVALTLAVAFGVSLGIFSTTYQAEKLADARYVVGGDLRVTPAGGATAPVAPTAAALVMDSLRVGGVIAITPVYQTSSAIVGTDRRALLAIQPGTFDTVADFKPGFLVGLSSEGAMGALANDPNATLVDVELAKAFNIQVGDPVKLQLPDRLTGKPVPLTLHAVGLFKNFPGVPQGVDLVTNIGVYQGTTQTSTPDFYLLRTDGTDATNAAVAAALAAGPGRSGQLTIDTTAKTFNLDQSSLAALNLNGLGRLEGAYTVLMSALGIGIFVFGMLLQRRKEHVTMRALGMRMRQVQTLVLGEAGAVTLLSLVIGTIVGIAMSMMFVQILTPLFTVPPQGLTFPVGLLALLALLVLVATALSSLIAGVALRRTALVELLREE